MPESTHALTHSPRAVFALAAVVATAAAAFLAGYYHGRSNFGDLTLRVVGFPDAIQVVGAPTTIDVRGAVTGIPETVIVRSGGNGLLPENVNITSAAIQKMGDSECIAITPNGKIFRVYNKNKTGSWFAEQLGADPYPWIGN